MSRKRLSFPRRTEPQVRGYQANLIGGISACEDGAYVEIDMTTARALVEICQQLREHLNKEFDLS